MKKIKLKNNKIFFNKKLIFIIFVFMIFINLLLFINSTIWDVSTAFYDNVNISTQGSNPNGIFFSSDGTKLYEVSEGDGEIYQYTCTTAWNLSSCSYHDALNTQDSDPEDLFFKSDGTKLYEISHDKMYQYTCPAVSDISDCSYDGISISTHPDATDLFFKSDGTKLYELNQGFEGIYQYTCTTAWNLSSCSYDGTNISVVANYPGGLYFKSDGTKFYVTGIYPNRIYQYICTTAWNLSSCSYDSKQIITQDSDPEDLFFKSDGTKLYEVGKDTAKIYQYSIPYYIDIITPTSSQIFTEDTPTAYFNITTNVSMDVCRMSLNSGVTNYSMTNTSVYDWTLANTSMIDGSHTVIYYCNQTSNGTWITSNTIDFEVDPINITTCRNLNVNRNYYLQSNISSSGDCLIVKNSSIDLDLNSYTVTSTTADAVDIQSSSYDNLRIFDGFLNGTDDDIDTVSGSTNNTAINVTYYGAGDSGSGQIIRKWYFQTEVNNSDGYLTNAAVNITNIIGTRVHSKFTNSTGNIARQEVIEYINSGGSKLFQTNHTVNVSKTGFTTNSTIYNITTNIFHYVSLLPSLFIEIDKPKPQAYSYTTDLPLNYSVINYTLIDSCWYWITNSTGDMMNISGGGDVFTINTTLPNCLNTTFNLSRDDIYTLHLWINETGGVEDNDSVTFSISTVGPAVVLDSPLDNNYSSNGTNTYFNFTATDTDGLSTAQLWHNNTGTWHKNYTWIGPTSAIMNWTNLNLSENTFIWSVWSNDTANNGGWALNNFTLTIDETAPNVTILTTNDTTVNGYIITIEYNISDANIDSCYFSLRTSGGVIHNYVENTSLVCSSSSRSITTLAYGTFVFQLWAQDYAGNLNHSNLTFTTRERAGTGSGGGSTTIEPTDEEEKTFCGDGICQSEGNDYGILEDFYNCPQDCKGFNFDELLYGFTKYCWDGDPLTNCFWTQILFSTVNGAELEGNITTFEDGKVCYNGVCEKISMDTLFQNCLDGDPLSPCFFNSNVSAMILFGGGALLVALTFLKVKDPTKIGKKVNLYQYIYISAKQLKKKRRRR